MEWNSHFSALNNLFCRSCCRTWWTWETCSDGVLDNMRISSRLTKTKWLGKSVSTSFTKAWRLYGIIKILERPNRVIRWYGFENIAAPWRASESGLMAWDICSSLLMLFKSWKINIEAQSLILLRHQEEMKMGGWRQQPENPWYTSPWTLSSQERLDKRLEGKGAPGRRSKEHSYEGRRCGLYLENQHGN